MCNCGKKTSNATSAHNTNQVYQQQEIKPVQQGIQFRYTGTTALTTIGNVTGRRYRFNYPNDTQIIDKQDAIAMHKVPVLQEV